MIELYNHQKVALSYLRINDSFALYLEQGLGKTLPTLFRILELFNAGDIDSALVIAPKSALGAWERDIEKFDQPDRDRLRVCITLVNYDRVWRGGTESQFYTKWDCIVLDEAHWIKNRTSRRSKFILDIATMSRYRYILTGTPISNGQLENIWSLYCFLDPYKVKGRIYSNIFKGYMNEHASGEYKGSYAEFEKRYCVLNMYHKPSGYINVKELQQIINEHSYRKTKAECLDLPEKLPDEIVEVQLKEKALYKRLATESAIVELDVLAENPLSRLVKLRQLASGHIQTDDGLVEVKTEKLDILKELIEGYPEDKKLVIFADFKYSIRSIDELLSKMKIKHILLDGEQKNKLIWRDFQADPTIRIIVCQYQTASTGIDLFAADTIIYYEPTLRSQILEQSRDRIHRNGQTNKCSYIHLLTKGTVEMHIYKALAEYGDFSDRLFKEYMSTYRREYST